MSYFLTLRTGSPNDHQFGRTIHASFEQAQEAAEHAFLSKGAEYLIEDERGPIAYRLK